MAFFHFQKTCGLLFVGIGLLNLGAATFLNAANKERRPNVVFILADDLGWSDTTLFGTTKLYETPNIERLAGLGITYRRAYSSSPLCSPTRASILTGLSPARHGITSPNCHTPQVTLEARETEYAAPTKFSTIPESVLRLKTEYYTLAEMLRDNGYATGHFGKWHLGPEPYSPFEHGFSVDIPHHPGPGPAGSYVAPWKFKDFDHDPDTPDQHIEDRMAEEAIQFIEDHQDEPFFLNYWMFSVHAPFDAKRTLIEKYRGKVDSKAAQRSPTYAAMIESMDDAVGTLLNTLERLKLEDNTIIIFASDNGGNMYNLVDGATATSNAPLRGGKATMYEGGIRGPAIVHVPGATAPGSTSDEIIQSVDFYPTLMELLSIKAAPNQVFDGVSIIPTFDGQKLHREAIFTYFPHAPNVPDWLPPCVCVHSGKWKLIRIFHGGPNGEHRYQLFDLNEDIGEERDLASVRPDVVQRLDKLIDQHLEETDAVLPLRNPRFDPKAYDPSLEGKAELKGSKGKQSAQKKTKLPVAGWTPRGTCDLANANGKLVVKSTGGDPYLSFKLDSSLPKGRYLLSIQMKSDSGGNGQFYWKSTGQPFARERSVTFDIIHDSQMHRYDVEFATSVPLDSIRLDPSRARGTIEIDELKLQNQDGEAIKTWDF